MPLFVQKGHPLVAHDGQYEKRETQNAVDNPYHPKSDVGAPMSSNQFLQGLEQKVRAKVANSPTTDAKKQSVHAMLNASSEILRLIVDVPDPFPNS